MNRLLIILLFPTFLFSQTFDDLKSINSLDLFKKVMIENNYEFDGVDDDGGVMYGYEMEKDEESGEKWAVIWAYYNNGRWSLKYALGVFDLGGYKITVSDIKEKCNYVNIENYKGYDYATYRCDNSKSNGKLGFGIFEGNGIIKYFPSNNTGSKVNYKEW